MIIQQKKCIEMKRINYMRMELNISDKEDEDEEQEGEE